MRIPSIGRKRIMGLIERRIHRHYIYLASTNSSYQLYFNGLLPVLEKPVIFIATTAIANDDHGMG